MNRSLDEELNEICKGNNHICPSCGQLALIHKPRIVRCRNCKLRIKYKHQKIETAITTFR